MTRKTFFILASIMGLFCHDGAHAQTQLNPLQINCPVTGAPAPTNPVMLVWIPVSSTTVVAGAPGATVVNMVPVCVLLDPSAFKIIANAANVSTITLSNPGPGPLPNFVFNEIPVGATDGKNAAFTVASVPSPATSVQVFVNGLEQATTNYTVSGAVITFNPGMQPPAGATIAVSYTH